MTTPLTQLFEEVKIEKVQLLHRQELSTSTPSVVYDFFGREDSAGRFLEKSIPNPTPNQPPTLITRSKTVDLNVENSSKPENFKKVENQEISKNVDQYHNTISFKNEDKQDVKKQLNLKVKFVVDKDGSGLNSVKNIALWSRMVRTKNTLLRFLAVLGFLAAIFFCIYFLIV
jgi:hypothetical protein